MWVRSFQPSNSDSVTSSIICSFVPHICWPFKHLTRVKGPDFAPSADRNLPKNSGGTERKRDQDVLYVRKPEAERIPAIACFYVNCQQSGGKHPYRPPPQHSTHSAAPTQTWNVFSHWPLCRIVPSPVWPPNWFLSLCNNGCQGPCYLRH